MDDQSPDARVALLFDVYGARFTATSLQGPSPFFPIPCTRNSYTAPGVSPVPVNLLCRTMPACTHAPAPPCGRDSTTLLDEPRSASHITSTSPSMSPAVARTFCGAPSAPAGAGAPRMGRPVLVSASTLPGVTDSQLLARAVTTTAHASSAVLRAAFFSFQVISAASASSFAVWSAACAAAICASVGTRVATG